MQNKLLSPQPLWQNTGLAILRIITGLLMTYHGWEVFDAVQINEYAKWDAIKTLPQPLLMAYFGKAVELASGILLTLDCSLGWLHWRWPLLCCLFVLKLEPANFIMMISIRFCSPYWRLCSFLPAR